MNECQDTEPGGLISTRLGRIMDTVIGVVSRARRLGNAQLLHGGLGNILTYCLW